MRLTRLQRKALYDNEKVLRGANQNNGIIYECIDGETFDPQDKNKMIPCDWSGPDPATIDDMHDRWAPGYIMAAGQCPKCGSMVYHDEDIDYYVIKHIVRIARERGII